jgi:hypothetical protein
LGCALYIRCALYIEKYGNIYPIAYVLNPHSEWLNILMTDYNKLHHLDKHTLEEYMVLNMKMGKGKVGQIENYKRRVKEKIK